MPARLARLALTEVNDLDGDQVIRDQAEVMRQYVRQRDDSLEAQNLAAEIKLRAERRAGEMLKVMPKHAGARTPKVAASPAVTPEIPTLDDLGITRRQSSYWQQIASIPEEKFERYIARTKDAEIKLRAERRAGEMLKVMPKNSGAAKKREVTPSSETRASPPTLEDLGISWDQSSNWQRIADITEKDIKRHNAATTVAEITRADARRKTSHPR